MYCQDSLFNGYPLVHEPEGIIALRFKTQVDPYAPGTLYKADKFRCEPVDPGKTLLAESAMKKK
ncbi:MAG: hypothetical protein WBL42_02065 [Methanoregula sp.]